MLAANFFFPLIRKKKWNIRLRWPCSIGPPLLKWRTLFYLFSRATEDTLANKKSTLASSDQISFNHFLFCLGLAYKQFLAFNLLDLAFVKSNPVNEDTKLFNLLFL